MEMAQQLKSLLNKHEFKSLALSQNPGAVGEVETGGSLEFTVSELKPGLVTT